VSLVSSSTTSIDTLANLQRFTQDGADEAAEHILRRSRYGKCVGSVWTSDEAISWSLRGSTPLGYIKLDVANDGIFGFTATPVALNYTSLGGIEGLLGDENAPQRIAEFISSVL
jgi:hypothetical protein